MNHSGTYSGTRRSVRRIASLALALSVGMSATAAFASTSQPAAKKKPLSLNTIILNGGYSGNPGLFWVALDKGFWAKQGLHASILDTSVSGSDSFAVMASGRSQFVFAGSISGLIARGQGADVRGVMSIDIGSPAELAMTDAQAQAIGFPQVANTAAGAKKQLLALRGSHLTVGITNTGSDNYSILRALLLDNGMTVSLNGSNPNADVNFTTLGSSATLVSAYLSGKIKAFAITPPYTLQANTAIMKMHLISPISYFPWVYLLTSTSLIKQHPDTVQATVTGLVQAMAWERTHRQEAQRITAAHYAGFGYTDPTIQQALFAATSNDWHTPLMSKNDFAIQKQVARLAGNNVDQVAYSDFLYPKFVNNAVKQLHLHFPNY